MTSSTSSSERSTARLAAALTAVLSPLLVCGLALAWLSRPPVAEDSELADELRARLAEASPHVVVLGNSVAERAIDRALLGALLADGTGASAPLRIADMTVTGSSPAIWYVVLENLVFGAGAAPELVLVPSTMGFFLRTDVGKDDQQLHLAQLSGPREPVVERLSGWGEGGWLPMQRIERARLAARADVLDAVRELAVGTVFVPPRPVEGGVRGRGRWVATPALARVFAGREATDTKLRRRVIPIVETGRGRRAVASPHRVEDTYVAALLDLAAEHDSRVVFVWVPAPGGRSASDKERAELGAELIDYLRGRGAGWIDLSLLPLPADAWSDRYHMSAQGSEAFTQALAAGLTGPRSSGAAAGGEDLAGKP